MDEKLYAVGGLLKYKTYSLDWEGFYPSSKTSTLKANFLAYDMELNKWNDLPSLKKPRKSILLVHSGGFLYAIGGQNEKDTQMNDVERFDFTKNEWQTMASLPDKFRWVSAVDYKGIIVVYGVSVQHYREHENRMLVFNPYKNVWQAKLSEICEDESAYFENLNRDPVLVVHNGHCYRVLYDNSRNTKVDSDLFVSWYEHRQPRVNLLAVHILKLSVGQEIKQDLIPLNKSGAFCIHDDVFINSRGSVLKTDVKLSTDKKKSAKDLSKWKSYQFHEDLRRSNCTWLTVDWKAGR